MKELTVHSKKRGNHVAILDNEDYKWASKYRWSYCGRGYAATYFEGKIQYLARLIMKAPRGVQVDHKNGNKLDNRRVNLRFCNNKQNNANVGRKRNNTSGYIGVRLRKYPKHRPWLAEIRINGRKTYLGYFPTAIQAARVYDVFAKREFGIFASLNEV